MSYLHHTKPYFHMIKMWGKTKDEILVMRPDLSPDHVDDLITYHHPGVLEQHLQQKESDGQHQY